MRCLSELVAEAAHLFSAIDDLSLLEQAKSRYLGKTGELTERMKSLSTMPPQQRPQAGQEINAAKTAVEAALALQRHHITQKKLADQLAQEAIDVSLPGRGCGVGSIHPVMHTWHRIETIFASIGFDVTDGPEIESDWFNFTALNQPADHPARSMHDTFYLASPSDHTPWLLRTHTSPLQVRYASTHTPPIRVIAPGKAYRVDSDATHSPMFHQVEGLWLDENISFADLKGVYIDFIRCFFETNDLDVRFRPSFFPFTEPSAEIDIRFHDGPLKNRWLEVSGAGQVHPQVIRNYGFDPEKTVGFAFGSGLERLTMLRYGVSDLRWFYEGDLRFLQQFA